MARYNVSFVFIQAIITFCLCEIDVQKKAKLVNGFVDFYNSLPNEIYTCDEGILQSAQQTDISNAYEIAVTLKVSETRNLETTKYLKCKATVADLDVGVAVMKHQCRDDLDPGANIVNIAEQVAAEPSVVTETPFIRRPIQLDNEVQTDTVTSGEQFIAVPREEPKVHCIGCSSHVNPQAEGVSELADIGVRQLNSLEPNVQHTLSGVADVERQVQVVNGVRYILTLLIDYNSCQLKPETDPCLSSKACKITILEKPWMQLPDGSKYRAILSNNCTEEWRFGDDGVVVPSSDNKESNNIDPSNPGGESDIKVIHNVDIQSQQRTEKTLTNQDIKNIEEQIVPLDQLSPGLEVTESSETTTLLSSDVSKEHVVKVESQNQHSPNLIHNSQPQKVENLADDKKKAIDDLINFFNFAGLDTKGNTEGEAEIREKRSFDSDLEVMHLAERFNKLKKSIKNAKYIYMLAQTVVDYLNDIDLKVKDRVLKDVITAEEESENHNYFYYIQFRTIVPCKITVCAEKYQMTKICNAIIDNSEKNPQILNVFCYVEDKTNHVGKMSKVPVDDPVLVKLIEESIKKIEIESHSDKARKLNQVIDASTQKVSGTLTKFSIVLDQTDCDKLVPFKLRTNCSIVEEYGSRLCDVTIHERHWLKERTITYSCTDRPIDIRFSEIRNDAGTKTSNDPEVLEMVHEALKNLEQQSNEKYKQILININSVSTQLAAGFLTNIEFIVGYTTCPSYINNEESHKCRLLENEPLRTCLAKVWDRTWIEDGRQVEVSCKEPDTETKIIKQSLGPSGETIIKDVDDLVFKTESKTREKQERAKRELMVGGEKEQDPNNSKYKMLAQESLEMYIQNTGNSQPHKIDSIEKVTTQVVAGTITRIDFKISPAVHTSGDVISCHSEIWERPWLKKKEINVSCEINDTKVRTKRQLPGGQTEQDPNNSIYKKLAQESLQKYLQNTGNSQPHKIDSIEKVTTRVVAGTITRIDFKISPAVHTSGDVISCHSEIWERPWLKKKEINVSCEINDTKVRTKRQLPGGQTEQDPNNSIYKKLAQESLQKYLQKTGNSQPHKIDSIEKVTTQVVAGTITRIDFKISPAVHTSGDVISCHSEIWERPWLKKKEINVSCEINDTKVRRKRNLGGEKEQDPNNSKYKMLAQESLEMYIQNTGNSQPHKIDSIEKVTTQVVAGTITRIDFKISPAVHTSGDVISCHSEIWERPWLKKKEINVSCEINDTKVRTKRQLPGGQTEQDPNNSIYKKLAQESLQKYLQNTGNSQPHKIDSIEKVTTQVVAGTITRIDFKISPEAHTSGDVIKCHSEIWERPWLKEKEINISCEIDNAKTGLIKNSVIPWDKRGIYKRTSDYLVGGYRPEDPTKPEYRDIAEDSLLEYKKKHNSSRGHVVVNVKKVSKKVVSGLKYVIIFTAAPKLCADDVSNCEDDNPMLNCKAFVLYSWRLFQKDIQVSCKSRRNRDKRSVNSDKVEEDSKFHELTEIDFSELDNRGKRQLGPGDDYIDEDVGFYYADRAIQQLNDQTRSSNLHKLITLHGMQRSLHMGKTPMVRMYIETAESYCLRRIDPQDKLASCEEMDANNHRLCLARLWPSPDDEMVLRRVSVVCDNDKEFVSLTGLSITSLLKNSIQSLEKSTHLKYKLIHQGEPQLIPSLDPGVPMKLNFIVRTTNCSKHVQVDYLGKFNCWIDTTKPAKACTSSIWLVPNSNKIAKLSASCAHTELRKRRSISLNPANATVDDLEILNMVKESLEKLEMSTSQRYKQRVLKINSYSTKLTSGKVTTIDFDVGYTSCLKYEWVDDIKACEFMDHLPRRHCISEVWERLWLSNGRNIEVRCYDEEVPLEGHVQFESAESATALANRALKHIEAKYPLPRKQKVVRIFSLDKQMVAGLHYRMKMEVGATNCSALSQDANCVIDNNHAENKFCRVNVWVRPWTDHPPNFRVTCDYQEGAMADLYHQVQAEHLFRDFLATFTPEYIDDHVETQHRFEVFKANIRRIHELNTHELGTASYGVTRFADLTYEEFTKKHMGLKRSLRNVNLVPMRKAQIPTMNPPESFDWREHGAVTEVKDQGSCGSCWAFSVTGNIEGQWQLKSGKLVSLSEQELVDCDKMDDGCNGGLPDNAYRAIEQLGGLETESDYPYEGEDDKCVFNSSMSRVQITGALNITTNETDMAKWLVKNGPISIGINANAMQFYMGGVSHPWKMLCSPSNLDHGVLIVGYGIKNYPLFHKRLPYWIVKNSWGPSWGEKGYYRVYRGDGTCGVNQMASSAVI